MATSHLIGTAGYAVRPVVLQNMWPGGLGLHKNMQKASCCSDVSAVAAGFRLRMELEGAWKTKPFWNYLYEHAQRKGSCGFTMRFRDSGQGCLDFPAVWDGPFISVGSSHNSNFLFFFLGDRSTDYANFYQGLWDCTGALSDELSFKRGDVIYILSKVRKYPQNDNCQGEIHSPVLLRLNL